MARGKRLHWVGGRARIGSVLACLLFMPVISTPVSAGGHSRLEPDWLVSLGGAGADETALTISFAADGTLLAAGTNSSQESAGGFRISVDPATGKELSRAMDAAPTVSLAPNQRGFLGGERRDASGFVMAMYVGNDSRTPEWWNLSREPLDRLDRVAALGGGWTAAAGFINGSGVVQVHNYNGHLESIVFPRVGDLGFRSIGVTHDGAGGLLLAGSSRTDPSTGYGNLFVERYRRDGEKLWGGEWDSGRPTAVVTAITALPDGTAYVTGWATKGGEARPHVPFATQFSPDGDETWSQLLALDPTRTDAEARDVCAAPDGSVGIVGTDLPGETQGIGEPRVRVNVLTISRGQAGKSVDVTMDVRWERSGGVEAESCVYGPDGALYISGSALDAQGDRNAFVGRFDLAKLQERIANAEFVQLGIFAVAGVIVAVAVIFIAVKRPRRARKVRVEPALPIGRTEDLSQKSPSRRSGKR